MRRLLTILLIVSTLPLGAAKPTPREWYMALTRDIAESLVAQQWEEATRIAQTYEKRLKDYPDYIALMATLSRDIDTTVVLYPFPKTINTPGDEYGPVLSADGKTLYFCGNHRRDNLRGEDIYVSHRVDGEWTEARVLKELCSSENDAPLSLSLDGQVLFMFRRGQLGYSTRSASGWTGPMPMPEVMRLSSWQADAMLSADGQALLFVAAAATADDPVMSPNIFVSLMQEDGTWGTPFSLGTTINTPYIDRSPYLHPDMKTLYFASEGHGSLGGLDIYMSTRLHPDSWTEWSVPVNLGKQINTPGNDCWYKVSTDGSTAYLSRPTMNNGLDLCRLPLPEYLRAEPMTTAAADEPNHREAADTDSLVPTVDKPLRLRNVFFPFGSAHLLSTSEPELQYIVTILLARDSLPLLEVAGHTDAIGSAERNLELSELRAAAVRDWLIEHGYPDERLTARGYGETEPVADNSTTDGRAQNRRVELRVRTK